MREHKKASGSSLGALGVVFGDIGTSPLYVLPAAFFIGNLSLDSHNIIGLVSMVLWAITMIVFIKYVTIIMRVDNGGEGGVMALLALLRKTVGKTHKKRMRKLTFIGFIGVALFFGDGIITPAISVLSAVEGVEVSLPALASWVIPIALVVLTLLFAIQYRGTGKLGVLFGPLMMTWFVVSGLVGLVWILKVPEVLWAISPLSAVDFIVRYPLGAFIALGAVVLSITGAEALYAGMGHFGRKAITKSWFMLVYPALILNYLGQGAVLLSDSGTQSVKNTYFYLFPEWASVGAVVLATIATFIASQSVIAGAFSITRQAVRLGYLPRLKIIHPSDEVGQVYIAGLNWLMYAGVVLLVIGFNNSNQLASAYGMAESGTLVVSTLLLLAIAKYVWPRRAGIVYAVGAVLLVIEGSLVVSASTKLVTGAWVPIVIAILVLIVISTWTRGSEVLSKRRKQQEGLLSDFIISFKKRKDVVRNPGTSVYLAHHKDFAPLAMRASVDRLHELSQQVVIVVVRVTDQPHVLAGQRANVSNLGDDNDGIMQVILHFGFNEIPNVPLALKHLIGVVPELGQFDADNVNYFISDSEIVLSSHVKSIGNFRARLFASIHRLSAPTPTYFRLPPSQTIDIATYVEL